MARWCESLHVRESVDGAAPSSWHHRAAAPAQARPGQCWPSTASRRRQSAHPLVTRASSSRAAAVALGSRRRLSAGVTQAEPARSSGKLAARRAGQSRQHWRAQDRSSCMARTLQWEEN
eukprot:3941409-Prymnesium_polylepis.2